MEFLKFLFWAFIILLGIKILADFIGFVRQEDAKYPKMTKKDWLIDIGVIIFLIFLFIIAE